MLKWVAAVAAVEGGGLGGGKGAHVVHAAVGRPVTMCPREDGALFLSGGGGGGCGKMVCGNEVIES